MTPVLPTRRSARPTLALLLVAPVWLASISPGSALAVFFSENFDQIPLIDSPTYGANEAFSLDPPSGWDRRDDIPGQSSPNIGVPEWKGWSFAREDFWRPIGAAFGDRLGRGLFEKGQNVVAVADSDLWNDPSVGDPANNFGFYNTFLQTPEVFVPQDTNESIYRLVFDTSWRGECCDDGQFLDDERHLRNNQTAVVRLRIDGGAPIEVLRWESAPFRDSLGRPTDEPVDTAGNANAPNPFFLPFDFDGRVSIDLTPFFDFPGGVPGAPALLMAASASGGGGVQVEFGMEEAGDDGWWALDNIEMASLTGAIDGDLYIDGMLDAKDIEEFAFGLLNENAYIDKWYGEAPGDRGSPDSVFDYDDIPWFLSVMEGHTAVSPALLLSQALSVPEPASALVVTIGLAGISVRPPRPGREAK